MTTDTRKPVKRKSENSVQSSSKTRVSTKTTTRPSTTTTQNAQALVLSVLAGACGALASVLAKIAVDRSQLSSNMDTTNGQQNLILETLVSLFGVESWVFVLLRPIAVAGLIACNALMWSFFTKSLNLSSSSTFVTVVNTASNFCLTALFGYTFFYEPLTLTWWMGASLILIGTLLMIRDHAHSSVKGDKVNKVE